METNDALISTPLILIVDDDRATRTLLKVAMEEEGYRVIEAKDGEQCLIEYNRHHPDMVLLDAVMPEMDGFTCCQELQKVDDGYPKPILMITALDDQDSIDQAFAVGAIDYITKPIHWAVLAQRVKRLLATNKALEQLERLQTRLLQQTQWLHLLEAISHWSASPSLENVLERARQIAQVDRLILYSFDGTIRLESTKKDIPSTQALATQNIGLDAEAQPRIIALKDLLASDLSETVIAPLVQLQTRAILMLPLRIANQSPLLRPYRAEPAVSAQPRSWGFLCVHQCQNPYPWQDWQIDQFKLFSNLLTNLITHSSIS